MAPKSSGPNGIFARLADPATFTGVHKQERARQEEERAREQAKAGAGAGRVGAGAGAGTGAEGGQMRPQTMLNIARASELPRKRRIAEISSASADQTAIPLVGVMDVPAPKGY